MKCTSPWELKDDEGKIKSVRCGRCMACRITRAQEWSVRLLHEMSLHEDLCYITLTYNEQCIRSDFSLEKKELVKFFKRLRKKIEPKKIKYYACGEYGEETYRPHYHAIVFGWNSDNQYFLRYDKGKKMMSSKELDDLWRFGENTIDLVNLKAINYVTKYITKKLYGEMAEEFYGSNEVPFNLMSKGLGYEWYKKNCQKDEFLRINGKDVMIPKYYRRKNDIKIEELAELPISKEEKLYKKGYLSEDIQRLIRSDNLQREKKLNKRAELFDKKKL